jgi:hypothetical protein
MDIHQQMLGIAGKLRTAANGAAQFSEPAAQEAVRTLTKTADVIDPNVYAPAADGNDSALVALRAAIQDLDEIPDEIRPRTADSVSDELRSVLTVLESSSHA